MSNEVLIQPSFSPAHRWKIGLHVLLSIVALSAVVFMANYLAARHFKRLRWASQNRHELSPVTVRVLSSLTNEVKVIVFFDRKKPLYNSIRELLHEYELRCSRLNVEYIDYSLSRPRAEKVMADYKLEVEQEPDRVIFDGNGRIKTVHAKDLSEYDYKAMFRGEDIKRTGFKGEQLFTSALYGVVDPRPVVAYFADGHGEHDPSESGRFGYLEFAQVLEENNIAVKRLSSMALVTNDVPVDCQLLIIAGPRRDFLPGELDNIEKYLNQGGRLFVLFHEATRHSLTGLEKRLAGWGVEVGNDLVYEPSQSKSGENLELVISEFGPHPVVSPLRSSRLLLIRPRSIRQRPALSQSADAPKVIELASTGKEGVAAVGPLARPETFGKISLMAAVEKGTIPGVADRGATRIIVTGDSTFLKNDLIGLGANRDFLRNAANWLLNREILLEGIGPRALHEYRITITQGEMRTLRWLLLAGFPGSVLFLGWLVWLRRRS